MHWKDLPILPEWEARLAAARERRARGEISKQRLYTVEKASRGICSICGEPTRDRKTFCATHLVAASEYGKKRYAALVLAASRNS